MRLKNKSSQSGLSLIEVMIGVTISLLLLLLLLNVLQIFGKNKKQISENIATQISSENLITLIERDVRMAGYGFMPSEIMGCNLKRFYKKPITDLILRPVEIIDGLNGSPDVIRVMYSTKNKPNIPAVLIKPFSNSNFALTKNSLEIKPNDFLVVHDIGEVCSLLQVTNIDNDATKIIFESEKSNWNSKTMSDVIPSYGYRIGSSLTNLGEIVDITYGLNKNNQMGVENFISLDNSTNKQNLSSDIINFQAQYGYDDRSGYQPAPMVTKWASKIPDINKNNKINDSNDLQKILAVRIAIVYRNRIPEKSVNGLCNISIAPSWVAGNETSGVLEKTNIDVSKNSDASAFPNWACYKYKVLESVIPIRNVMWSE
jgi:type IV pilus assembly protein PilW